MTEYLGLAAATLAVLGAAVAIWRRLRRTASAAAQRLTDIEDALQSRAMVEFTAPTLVEAPGVAGGVLMVSTGRRGTLEASDRGWCTVRLAGQTTLVRTTLAALRVPPDAEGG